MNLHKTVNDTVRYEIKIQKDCYMDYRRFFEETLKAIAMDHYQNEGCG